MFQKAVEQLVAEGNVILQLVMPDGDNMYFAVYKWQEGYFNSAQSIDFNTVEGINITDFIHKNAAYFHNRTQFLSAFNKAMEDGVLLRCEFTKGSTWYKWSSPAVVTR